MLDVQFKKGVLPILVLTLIERQDTYGYALLQALDRESGGAFRLKEGTLYPVLYRLEDQGWIESYRSDPGMERRVPRKYYRITPAGRTKKRELQHEWNNLTAIVAAMTGEKDD